ncbi:uncharacterized protein LOC62_01G001471 [Vanrija pseudolonga]|uniref:CREG-like beta-barrel domain-containing protein n=1 Tax=Vanrija pseudolonga TaxID=143232 RepID=A0AAF0Y126_9TREE|nr:hypothetical protein LOC62_01G001471 [Vanrija pseudolonga]
MYLPTLILAATAAMATQVPLEAPGPQHRETLPEAVQSVKRLVKEIGTGTMASVFPETAGANAGYPYALMESHAPCHPDGALTFISFPISLMTRNIRADPHNKAAYTLQTPLKQGVSAYGQPRVSFTGNLTFLAPDAAERKRLEECFVEYHPDAKWWVPGDPDGAHSSLWSRLDITDIYYIGGFGNTGWIGHIPLELYRAALNE